MRLSKQTFEELGYGKINTDEYKHKIYDESIGNEGIKDLWLIDNPDGVDLDLYTKNSKWKLLRQDSKKIDALTFISILRGLIKHQGPASRLLSRLKMAPGLSQYSKDMFYM